MESSANFKILTRNIDSFWDNYIVPAIKNKSMLNMEGFDIFFMWMFSIKTFTENPGDYHLSKFDPFKHDGTFQHFAKPFMYVMDFTFPPSGMDKSKQQQYQKMFLETFQKDPTMRKSWIQVLTSMWSYIHFIENEHELKYHRLKGKYDGYKKQLETIGINMPDPIPGVVPLDTMGSNSRMSKEIHDVLQRMRVLLQVAGAVCRHS
jgi:hypothetical protein